MRALIDQCVERGAGQLGCSNRVSQRRRDFVLANRTLAVDLIQCLTPPLQANFAKHGFGYHRRDLSDSQIECVEREQVLALLRFGKEGRAETVRIARPHDLTAGGERHSAATFADVGAPSLNSL